MAKAKTIDFDDILEQITASQEAANKANLERYQEMMTHFESLLTQVGAQGTFGQALQLMETMGTAGRQRISEQTIKAQGAAEQDLMTRGLANTTIRTTAQRGISADAERATQELEEQVAMSKAGVLGQLAGAELQIGGMQAGAMERRVDEGPDLALYASLLEAAAATGGPEATPTKPPEPTSTATLIGPQAQAGHDVFGQPFEYGAASGGGFGGGGTPGGVTGGGLGGGAAGPSRVFPGGGGGGGWDTGGGTGGGIGGGGNVSGGVWGGAIPGGTPGVPGGTPEGGAVEPSQRPLSESEQNIQSLLEAEGFPITPGEGESAFTVGKPEEEEAAGSEYITDYAEYKKLAKNPVSPMYWTQVWGGRVARSRFQKPQS